MEGQAVDPAFVAQELLLLAILDVEGANDRVAPRHDHSVVVNDEQVLDSLLARDESL